MDIFRVIGIGLLGAIIALMLKQSRSEFSMLAVLATGVIILIIILNSLGDVIVAFNKIVIKSGISQELFTGLIKIIGVGYVTEYGASMCDDLGCGSISKKIHLAGKIGIFLMALPIVMALIDIIGEIVKV